LIDRFVLGSRQLPIVGSVEQVADTLIAWVDEGDVDGFNLSRTVVPECLEDFIGMVVPVLQERGRYKGACRIGRAVGAVFEANCENGSCGVRPVRGHGR